MSKYYFQSIGGKCYPMDYWLKYMKDLRIPEMPIYEAKREVGNGFFFCKEFDAMGETGEGCGKLCRKYEPRNKISGICKHAKPTYEKTENIKILKLVN